MSPAVFHPDARAEAREAGQYYESQRTGLGKAFRLALQQSLAVIRRHPCMWPKYKGKATRHCLIRKFPYCIFYIDQPDRIWIVAIAHARRRPEYWLDRIKTNT